MGLGSRRRRWPGASVPRKVGYWGCRVFLLLAIALPMLMRNTVEATLAVDDYAIVGEAFHATSTDEWPRAFRLIEQLDDPLATKTFRWLALVEDEADADFQDLATFIIDNPTWPELDVLQTMAEARLTDSVDKTLTLRLFEARAPLTTRGRIRFAEALLDAGRDKEAAEQIRHAWTFGDFSAKEQRSLAQRHGRFLGIEDHIARLDNLLWDRKWRSAERMLPRVSEDYRKLAKARLALQKRSPGVDRAVQAVPAELTRDPGLIFDRLRWRRLKNKHDGAVALLVDPPERLERPERWWYERSFQIRRAINQRDFDTAYLLASRHGQLKGSAYAEAEWLAGWLALRFVNRPKVAFRHFVRLYDRVIPPVRQARAAYWAGRAAAAQGDQAGAIAWYRRAAHRHAAYYGQLAAIELGDDLPVPPPAQPTEHERAAFEANELSQVARMLIAAGAVAHLDSFLIQLASMAETGAEIGMVAELANAAGRPVLLARLGRMAAFEGKVNEFAAFPIPAIEGLLQPAADRTEASLLLSLARQESMFDGGIASRAGARGLLQLMPSTAHIVARQLGETYDADRLISDPAYNARLGSHYLQLMLERFDGEIALAVAAYNAGPLRVKQWIELIGDPRTGDHHDLIDWIELIPFAETRNYVQRVLEGYRVYKRRLAEPEVIMIDYPGVNVLNPPPRPAFKPLDLAVDDAAAHRPRFKPLNREPDQIARSEDRNSAPSGLDARAAAKRSFDDRQSRNVAADEGEADGASAIPLEQGPKL